MQQGSSHLNCLKDALGNSSSSACEACFSTEVGWWNIRRSQIPVPWCWRAQHKSPPPPPPPTRTLEYYWMVMQNGNVVFPGPPGASPKWKSFTIHGAWPGDGTGTQLINCPGAARFIGEQKLLVYVPDMITYWPSVTTTSNGNFWAHQWKKHGSCSGLDQIQYFGSTVRFVSKNLRIYADFAKHGLLQGNAYPIGTINSTFFQIYRVYPKFKCGQLKGPPQYMALEEIWVNITTGFNGFQNYSDAGRSHDCRNWNRNVVVKLE